MRCLIKVKNLSNFTKIINDECKDIIIVIKIIKKDFICMFQNIETKNPL